MTNTIIIKANDSEYGDEININFNLLNQNIKPNFETIVEKEYDRNETEKVTIITDRGTKIVTRRRKLVQVENKLYTSFQQIVTKDLKVGDIFCRNFDYNFYNKLLSKKTVGNQIELTYENLDNGTIKTELFTRLKKGFYIIPESRYTILNRYIAISKKCEEYYDQNELAKYVELKQQWNLDYYQLRSATRDNVPEAYIKLEIELAENQVKLKAKNALK